MLSIYSSHLYLLLFILSFLVGSITLVLLLLAIKQGYNRLRYFFLFFALLTLQIFSIMLYYYVIINFPESEYSILFYILLTTETITALNLYILLIFVHDFFKISFRTIVNISALIIITMVVINLAFSLKDQPLTFFTEKPIAENRAYTLYNISLYSFLFYSMAIMIYYYRKIKGQLYKHIIGAFIIATLIFIPGTLYENTLAIYLFSKKHFHAIYSILIYYFCSGILISYIILKKSGTS